MSDIKTGILQYSRQPNLLELSHSEKVNPRDDNPKLPNTSTVIKVAVQIISYTCIGVYMY